MEKYSKNFERDFNWYLSIRHKFNFCGKDYDISFDSKGISGKLAFHLFDSQGIIKPTKHPRLLKTLLVSKGSVNLFAKMYAEDRASGILPKKELEQMCKEWEAPEWYMKAIEYQKARYY